MAFISKVGGNQDHRPRHDLESFYWVLLWVAVRHTRHSRRQNICERIFVYGDDEEAADCKWKWIAHIVLPGTNPCPLVFVDNDPLTVLLDRFRLLIKDQYMRPSEDILTYDAVLAIFDEALGMDGWPTQCDRVPYAPLDNGLQSVNTSFRLRDPTRFERCCDHL